MGMGLRIRRSGLESMGPGESTDHTFIIGEVTVELGLIPNNHNGAMGMRGTVLTD